MAVEAMLSGIPTLIFDPFAFPIFTPSAWFATSWQSAITSLSSLLSPTQTLATYQDSLCPFIAVGDGGATQRITDTITSIIENKKLEDPQPPEISPPGDEQKIPALSATISTLEAQLRKTTQKQVNTEKLIFNPSMKFVKKSAARFLKQSIKSTKN